MSASQRNPDRPIASLLAPDILVMLDEAPANVTAETEEMHPADLADVVEALPRERIVAFLGVLPRERAADVLQYLDDDLRTELLEEMTASQAAALVTQMTPDDRADALEELEDDRADEILSAIPIEQRQETERLLAWPPESAGGLMTTEFVSVYMAMTVEDALVSVRTVARTGRREAMYSVYATDAEGRLQGVLSLRELLAAPEGSKISDVAWSEVVAVKPTADREEVARMTTNYDLVAVPVTNDAGQIIGVVTVDDVIDAIQEEQTEDVQKFGGMEALDVPYMQMGLFSMMQKRAGWLCVLLLGEMLTAAAMGHYEADISNAVVLALFIPLIISSGGNSGSQATSLIIRAMALQEIQLRDWWRVLLREIPSGLLLGVILGTIGFARVVVWHELGLYDYGVYMMRIALTVGFALVGVVTFGSLTGSMLPFLLRRLGFDPASSSAPFVATLVDVTGLVIYFNVAFLLLSGRLL